MNEPGSQEAGIGEQPGKAAPLYKRHDGRLWECQPGAGWASGEGVAENSKTTPSASGNGGAEASGMGGARRFVSTMRMRSAPRPLGTRVAERKQRGLEHPQLTLGPVLFQYMTCLGDGRGPVPGEIGSRPAAPWGRVPGPGRPPTDHLGSSDIWFNWLFCVGLENWEMKVFFGPWPQNSGVIREEEDWRNRSEQLLSSFWPTVCRPRWIAPCWTYQLLKAQYSEGSALGVSTNWSDRR